MAAQQEKPMTSTQRTETTTNLDGARKPAVTGPAFKIRYGRLAIALAGLLLLLTGVVSAALRIIGIGASWLPVVALLGGVAAVVTLRRLAVRDRRRKVSAAFRAAMSAPARPKQSAPERTDAGPGPAGTAKRTETTLFDAQAEPAVRKPAPKPLSAQELRQAALAEAAASGDTSVRLATAPFPPATEGSSWEPVDVPRPTYVEAPKAERAAPEPLDLPAAPKATGRPSLKQGASPQPASAAPVAPDADARPLGKAQSALSNLDDVLQRRRA